MKTRLLTMLLCCSTFAFGQGITGDWHGQLEVQGTSLRVVFHIVSTGEGYTSTMDSPDQHAKGIKVVWIQAARGFSGEYCPEFL